MLKAPHTLLLGMKITLGVSPPQSAVVVWRRWGFVRHAPGKSSIYTTMRCNSCVGCCVGCTERTLTAKVPVCASMFSLCGG